MDQFYCPNIITSEDYANFIIEKNAITGDYLSRYPGSCIQYVDNYAILYRPLNLIPNFNLNSIPYGTVPKLYGLMDTTAVDSTGAERLQNIPSLSLKGQGTITGFIDTGIDYTHPVFQNATGQTRIRCIWDQTIPSVPGTSNIINVPYGSFYDYNIINQALSSSDPFSVLPSNDSVGHGTFLAGVCSGSYDSNNDFISPAPEADIVVVKLKEAKSYLRNLFFVPQTIPCYQEDDIMSAVFFLLQYAALAQKPLIICIGLGSSQGAHIGSSPLDSMLNFYSQKTGCAISVAMGNEGNTRKHFSGVVIPEEEFTTAEFRVDSSDSGIVMELWGQPPSLFSIAVTSPSGETVPRIPARLGQSYTYYFLFDDTIMTVEYSLVENQSGAELILIRLEKPSGGIWKINVYSGEAGSGTFNIWLPLSNFSSAETFFLEANPNTTLTSPASAASPIAVAAYDPRNNSLYPPSGRGYTATGIIKPELSAPGVNVFGPVPGGSYSVRSGTSVSAALTAGVSAQFMTWAVVQGKSPSLTGLSLKNYLIRGATRLPNETYPNNTVGYGFLNAFNAFDIIRNL